ncbi:MAG TPA: hypothetical protein VFN26_04870 [Candidatus Acidoferrum sp.]|nr:hypothetical protein [Candidatus Acidoferrum sp.]
MISIRTKVLIGFAALPVVVPIAVVVFVIPLFFSGLGIDLPILHTGRIVALLVVWLIIVVSAVASFRRDRRQNTNN